MSRKRNKIAHESFIETILASLIRSFLQLLILTVLTTFPLVLILPGLLPDPGHLPLGRTVSIDSRGLLQPSADLVLLTGFVCYPRELATATTKG